MIYTILKCTAVPFGLLFVKKVNGLENLPKDEGLILAANHSSYLDPIMIPAIFVKHYKRKVRYLGKKELFSPWVMRKVHEAGGTIPIDRGGDEEALKNAIKALGEGKIIGIFPEGGRSRDGKLRKAKTGVARLALWGRSKVIPVGIKGSFDVWPAGKKFPKFKRNIEINFGKPIEFKEYYDKKINKKMLREITTMIMKEVAKLSSLKYRH